MKAGRTLPLLLPFLAGCFLFSSGKKSAVEEVPPELRTPRLAVPPVPDRHLYGEVSKVEVGQWTTYREGPRTVTLAAVAKAPEGLWIEVIEEGEVRQVSARLVGPEGEVLRASYREISQEGPSSVEPQKLEQWVAPVESKFQEVARETAEQTVKVGGRELKATAVRVTLEDLEGRRREELKFWHPDVPRLYAGSDAGGLVRRQAGELTVELVDFGREAKPLIPVSP